MCLVQLHQVIFVHACVLWDALTCIDVSCTLRCFLEIVRFEAACWKHECTSFGYVLFLFLCKTPKQRKGHRSFFSFPTPHPRIAILHSPLFACPHQHRYPVGILFHSGARLLARPLSRHTAIIQPSNSNLIFPARTPNPEPRTPRSTVFEPTLPMILPAYGGAGDAGAGGPSTSQQIPVPVDVRAACFLCSQIQVVVCSKGMHSLLV
jgi:hypothetical protein